MDAAFELVTTRSGAASIRNVALNQTMHAPDGPGHEARALYVEPSRLRERLSEPQAAELVLFDVGLGAAANALGAIRVGLELGGRAARRLCVVSFERDLELLAFALAHFDAFPHFAGFRSALQAILAARAWASPCGKVRWVLRVGNFLETIDAEALRPQIIFHDPYSPAANAAMWSTTCFAKIFRLATDSAEATSLFTYSCATPVRAALLLAGFYVGYGPATGRKQHTTQAATTLAALAQPFDGRWLKRWERSHARYPLGSDPEEHAAMSACMFDHPQFRLA